MQPLNPQPVKQKATTQDVKRSSGVGNAIMDYFIKYGAFPTSKEDLKK